MTLVPPPPAFSIQERIAMATRCRDADVVPKVHDAGQVFIDASGERVQIMHNGIKVRADGYYGEWMTDLIRLCRGHHESQEERMFHELMSHLPDDATMIELGGFWAYYSLWFLSGSSRRKAIVVEPDPRHLEVGQANARLNGLSPEFLHGFAGGMFAENVSFATEESGIVPTPCYPVEHLMAARGMERLTLLHCDAQGVEVEVLESCRELFRQGKVEWVFVSTHAHQISGDPLTHQRCLAILRECGATIEAEHDVHESFSGDGLIVARFVPAPQGWVPVTLTCNRHGSSLFRHLAYDLADAQQQVPAQEPPGLLADRGVLFELPEDCPLGASGQLLLMPRDQVMFPIVHAGGSWEFDDVVQVADRMRGATDYTLLDIGANVGLFTRQLLNLTDRVSRAICVEPDKVNFSALRYNVADARADVHCDNVALGQRDGAMRFYRDRQNVGNYSLNADAMRGCSYEEVSVPVRAAAAWMVENVPDRGAIIWKSDTQGYDEVIVSQVPMSIWERVEVALLETWRIVKPEFDTQAFRERLESFPHRRLGDEPDVSVNRIMEYLDGDDWQFVNLVLWR